MQDVLVAVRLVLHSFLKELKVRPMTKSWTSFTLIPEKGRRELEALFIMECRLPVPLSGLSPHPLG